MRTFLEQRWEDDSQKTKEERIAEIYRRMNEAESRNDEVLYVRLERELETLTGEKKAKKEVGEHEPGKKSSHPSFELDASERKEDGLYEIRVPGILIDENNHLNYAGWIHLLHQAHLVRLEEKESVFDLLHEQDLRAFVARNEFDYQGEAGEGDLFSVKTNLELGNTSITLSQDIKVNGKSAGKAKWVIVVVDNNGKPTTIPDKVRQILE